MIYLVTLLLIITRRLLFLFISTKKRNYNKMINMLKMTSKLKNIY